MIYIKVGLEMREEEDSEVGEEVKEGRSGKGRGLLLVLRIR